MIENITIDYLGFKNTGFKRFIPVNNGIQIRNIQINQIVENTFENIFHTIYYQNENLIFDIGNNQNKYKKTESYSINYELRILNKSIEEKNMIPLNVIGNKWACQIHNASVRIIVPSSKFIKAQCYIGNTKQFKNLTVKNENDQKIISSSFKLLKKFQGVKFYLFFQPNSIKSYVDHYCLPYIIKNIAILMIILVLKLMINKKNKICPTPYTSKLNMMDPLMMCKFINGKVNRSDITFLIFYWASKGFILINIDDEDDPIFVKNIKFLPDSYPKYQIYMFTELFKYANIVKSSSLKITFKKTLDQVIKMVNMQTNGIINNKSIILSLSFAIIGCIHSIIATFNIKNMISKEYSFEFLYSIIFSHAIIWFSRLLNVIYTYKINSDYVSQIGMIAVIIFGFENIYETGIPKLMMSHEYRLALFVSSMINVFFSASLITNSAYYKAKINEIFGLNEFIKIL